jgi:hypothetical protein
MSWPVWLPDPRGWTGVRYGRFRLLLGIYLLVHFAYLAPWAAEVFSSAGILPDGRSSPLLHLFPNVLALWDGPAFVTALVVLGAVLAAAFAVGASDRVAAGALAYLLACLYGRNPLIANPSLPYVGWMLLAHAALPSLPTGVGLWRGEPAAGWQFPRGLFAVAWILLAAGYSFSGFTKLVSPSWRDGTALMRVLGSPLARPGLLRDSLLRLPAPLLRAVSALALGSELLFLPLAAFRPTRRWIWAALLGMHLGLIALIDFADLSAAMVLVHLFVIEPRWLLRHHPGHDQPGHGPHPYVPEGVDDRQRPRPAREEGVVDEVPGAE